jgi:hypothetical protein
MNEISTELIKYIGSTLFDDECVSNIYEEVVIDNFPCYITLKYFKEDGRVRCILHNKNINKKLGELNDDYDDEYYFNLLTDPDYLILCSHIQLEEKCKYVLNNLNELIQNIKFCNYTGKFLHIRNIHYSNIRKDLPIFFKDNTNIKFKINEDSKCSICYETTMTTSSCNHPICMTCAINLKSDADQDIICPLCRDVLTFI